MSTRDRFEGLPEPETTPDIPTLRLAIDDIYAIAGQLGIENFLIDEDVRRQAGESEMPTGAELDEQIRDLNAGTIRDMQEYERYWGAKRAFRLLVKRYEDRIAQAE